ncbi:MAG: Fe-S-containing hydro-lyase [Candidatus Omnitrophica bacterium]|nr:Fe-S-containing hydro-lyase [Candidatus Omnitrophota bacterium]MDD5352016.1 Fe-S-containing hydro-lyase [Candidatus Omnitrophota bacterium]MDD5551070.1 Fe-S-containing hydro-lyase [Candidatus Omnitrophota bacterium]
MRRISTPLTKEIIKTLRCGQEILLSGTIYTARDQAHKRLREAIKKHKKLPFGLNNQIIYYCGPTNTPRGKIIGSCGPTTSSRMDSFTPLLLKKGLKGIVGKGERSREVVGAIKKSKAVYFLAPAGCGALLAKKVKSSKIIAYKDLGPEAIRKLEVKDFPLIVGIDSQGRSVYAAQ